MKKTCNELKKGVWIYKFINDEIYLNFDVSVTPVRDAL